MPMRQLLLFEEPTTETQRCRHCGEELPLDAFWSHPVSQSGRFHTCRACMKALDGYGGEHESCYRLPPFLPAACVPNWRMSAIGQGLNAEALGQRQGDTDYVHWLEETFSRLDRFWRSANLEQRRRFVRVARLMHLRAVERCFDHEARVASGFDLTAD